MIDYVYKAKDKKTGQILHANVKAESPQAAAKLLADQGLFALDIQPEEQKDILARIGFNRGVHLKDKVIFTRQLSTLITAGLPLARALRTSRDQVSNKNFIKVLDEVIADIEGGTTLSGAFAKHPKVFNEIYVAIVAAGETSGSLDKALLRLALQLEKDAAIISKVRSALVYPLIVLVLIVGVVIMMVTTVVPQVASLYHDLNKPLPLPTLVLVSISNLIKSFWWLLIVVAGVGVYFFRRYLATEKAKLEMDRIKLRVPLFGELFGKLYMARFCRTMNTLLASGIPMLHALETTQNAVGNRVVAEDISKVTVGVRGGKNLSTALEKQPHFHPLVAQMAGVGEESGAIDDMLGRAATYFEDEVDEAVKNLSTTLEPTMMVVLGLIVGGVILAVLGPVYGLVGAGEIK